MPIFNKDLDSAFQTAGANPYPFNNFLSSCLIILLVYLLGNSYLQVFFLMPEKISGQLALVQPQSLYECVIAYKRQEIKKQFHV